MNFPTIDIKQKDLTFAVRPDTSDAFVVREVWSGEYRRLNITPGDVICDFGMNISAFSHWACTRGAGHVYGFEPDPDNFQLAQHNILTNGFAGRITAFEQAVVGNQDTTRDFSINNHRNKGAHSLVAKRGRSTITVACRNIQDILDAYQPDIVKMDIEGGEIECLPAITQWHKCRELILEFHHAHLNDIKTHSLYNSTLQLLRTQWSKVEARQDTKGAWVNIIYCQR
jgi:FkbM family methyltransferase